MRGLSFRGDAQHRTTMRNCASENLEIPGLVLAHHPGMTCSDMHFRSRGMFCPRLSNSFASLSKERAQGMPDARCTRGLVCQIVHYRRTRAYRFSGGSPTSPAQWLYGLLRALPGERAFLPPSPRGKLPAKLSASIAAPGPHDFAVRLCSFVYAPKAHLNKSVHRIPSQRSVTTADAPPRG